MYMIHCGHKCTHTSVYTILCIGVPKAEVRIGELAQQSMLYSCLYYKY